MSETAPAIIIPITSDYSASRSRIFEAAASYGGGGDGGGIVTVTEGYVNAKIEAIEARIDGKLDHLPTTATLASGLFTVVISVCAIMIAFFSYSSGEFSSGMQLSEGMQRNRAIISSNGADATAGIVANKQAIGRLQDDVEETKDVVNRILEIVERNQAKPK